ncbi:MAG: DUF3341 domain-containing protein [Pyrinomonadaceae bacterium]
MRSKQPIYGLLAEFNNPTALVQAAERAHRAGYRKLDAYSPYPIEELSEALHLRRSKVALIVLSGGLLGAASGLFMQYYASVLSYPLNIGGRPLASFPSFIPITFEMTVLLASLIGAAGMLFLNGLPQPYHPVFNVERFLRASQDSFFLCIEAQDERFDYNETRRFLESLNATEVSDVEP